jgi:SulP family sulfate permease
MAAVGLLESLMTLNLIDELTDTKGNTMRECIGQGVANMICGALGGMGGCAMIGQSMINVSSGARTRLSSATAGICLLLVVIVLYQGINCIPVSGLVGVMFNVVFHTFEWSSLKLMVLAALPQSSREMLFSEARSKQKIRRADALVILAVTLVTLFTDLATAVAVGMVFACFMFAYDSADQVTVDTRETEDEATGQKIKYYDVHGTLFFGSCTKFLSLFDEKNDPSDVRLVFEAGYIVDYSAIEALNKLGERYGAHGKKVTLQQLKPQCASIVQKSAGLLVKELAVAIVEEEVLPDEREHLNVEHFDIAIERQTSEHTNPQDEPDRRV